jgi:hypothetical protein
VFRALWLAVLAGNVGTWMQTEGAQWLVVRQPEEHLAQHEGRLTGSDEAADRRADAMAEGPSTVTHLRPADSPD